MLTDLFTIFGGSAFIAGRLFHENKMARESDENLHSYFKYGEYIKNEANIDIVKFKQKYISANRELLCLEEAINMDKNTKSSFFINGIREFLPYDIIKDDDLIIMHSDIDRMVAEILEAKSGFIHGAYIDRKFESFGHYYKNSKKVDVNWETKWKIRHAFMKWLDKELQLNGVEPMLFDEKGWHFRNDMSDVQISLLKSKSVSSSSFEPVPYLVYYWWSSRANIII